MGHQASRLLEIILIHAWGSRGLIIEYLLLRRHAHGRTHHSRTHYGRSHHRLTHHRRTHHRRTHHRWTHHRRTHHRWTHHWLAIHRRWMHHLLAKHRWLMHHHRLLRRNSINYWGRLPITTCLPHYWLSRVHSTIIAGARLP